jgi:hypothetical protein
VRAREPDIHKLGDGPDGGTALRAGRAEHVRAGVLDAGRWPLAGCASGVLGALRYAPSTPERVCSLCAEDVPGALRVPGYVLYASSVRCSGGAKSASGWDSPARLDRLESGDLPVAHGWEERGSCA